MSWASSEAVAVLIFLLPGFVAAAVFHSLTAHPRPREFGYVVQSLVFTTVGQAVAWVAQWLASVFGAGYEWPAGLELVVSLLSASGVALLVAAVANHDSAHRLLRRVRVTQETSYPSEWYSAFCRKTNCYVVLHLKKDDELRLYGWPEEWPSQPHSGHFIISEPEWLDENDRRIPAEVNAILVPASDVQMVEFLSR